ncbi:hypothetical protein FIE12Z_10678 [Fusarium flagelliforme]|uniref:Homeobox domain-containing protein n=1 Tax=Fusarium flagelliforme TaxID=2675880 RepID=A0A395MB61_9HYPO|nr:hypothetical protein FIE12Z_10678 [Fusarium flagelliforme]
MPNASSFDIESKRWYPITRPASLSLPQVMACYYAFPFGYSRDHRPWFPESEVLEAVSDKPFSQWVDITGVREFIQDEISRLARRKVTIEACRVKGERNVRLMAFMLMEDNSWLFSPSLYDLSTSLERISDRLSSMGINDVKIEVWETDFHLMVMAEDDKKTVGQLLKTNACSFFCLSSYKHRIIIRFFIARMSEEHSLFPEIDFADLDDILNHPIDSATVDLPFSWDVDDTIDPQQLSSPPTFGGAIHVTDFEPLNIVQPSEPSNSPITPDPKPLTYQPKPGKRLSLISVRVLNKWLSAHTHHPYPTVAEVESIIRQTGLSKQQILNWFANARRRKKFERVETDLSSGSSEASPRDIPVRPPTPFVQQSPFERWRNSPPEDEPSSMAAIARAVSGAEGSIEGGRMRARHAPSVTSSWATSAETSDSSRSSHVGSDGSLDSMRKVAKKRRRAGPRGRRYGTKQLAQHLSLEQWECSPLGPTVLNEQSEPTCVYCGVVNPEAAHFEAHNHDLCQKRERGERTFYRKDHLRQHLRLVHGSELRKVPMEDWKFKHEDVLSRCGFCDISMTTWSERMNHLAEHFKEGMTMADWKGNWGFDASTLDMVENHMPPYLIDYERNSPLPFTTSQGAPYSSTSAFELLQLELDYFYSNYLDTHHTVPSSETLHLEACCIIFGAEISSSSTTQASSWLRDLILGTEHITAKARMTPMKSAAKSRFTELRIHSKKDIFEHCKLESGLREYVDMVGLLSLEVGDEELQKEACEIIKTMGGASPMFTGLLVGLVNASTRWLVPFRLRAGLTGQDSGQIGSQDNLSQLNALPFFGNIAHDNLVLAPALDKKIVSLNDGNMYRGLTRYLTRYVARTISPLNPTSHVPTDEELQYQARWIEYDSHDVWNQTPADNADWLAEFKKESGLFT